MALTHYSPVTKSIEPCTGNCVYGENSITTDDQGNEFQVIHSRPGETQESFLQRIEEYENAAIVERGGNVYGTVAKKEINAEKESPGDTMVKERPAETEKSPEPETQAKEKTPYEPTAADVEIARYNELRRERTQDITNATARGDMDKAYQWAARSHEEGVSFMQPRNHNPEVAKDGFIDPPNYTPHDVEKILQTRDRLAFAENEEYDIHLRSDGAHFYTSKSKRPLASAIRESREAPYREARSEYYAMMEKYNDYGSDTYIDEYGDEHKITESALESSEEREIYRRYHDLKEEREAEKQARVQAVDEAKKRHVDRLVKNPKRAKTPEEKKALKERLITNGKKHAAQFTNRKARPEYIDSIDKKHFGKSGAGSKFSKVKNTEDLITLASVQRRSMDGDDRHKLIAAGADPKSFLPPDSGVRYLMVKTPGSEALLDTSTMKDDDKLSVVAKGKNDGRAPSLSFVADVKEQPKTEYGTIIIGPKSDENEKPIPGIEHVWTAHPGSPSRGVRSADVREKGLGDDDTITVAEFRKMFGRDIKANTRVTG